MPLVKLRQRSLDARQLSISVVVGLVGILLSLPAVFVLFRTASLGPALWPAVSGTWRPLARTALLATCVASFASVIGTVIAWLLTRTDIPGRKVWRVVLVLPLVLPSFVGAAAFLAALAPGGVVQMLLSSISVDPPAGFRGFFPALLVLTAFTYPFVLLPVSARLLRLRPELEESSRLLGYSATATFRKVTLPQLRSSILTGSLLAFLYTLSDFGAVQLLGYDTLTRVIYATRLSARGVSFASASALLLLAGAVAGVERLARTVEQVDERTRKNLLPQDQLGLWRMPALGFLVLVALTAVVLPVASLATWAIRGLVAGRVGLTELWQPFINTSLVGLVTAAAAGVLIFPLAVLSVRRELLAARVASVVVVGGFAVPGIVIAISLVFWALHVPGMERLYQTFPLLIFAYVVHFGSQTMGSSESAVRAVPAQMRESAVVLHPSKVARFLRIDWPLMRPSLASGAGLVLLSTIKELPATLLLSPIGFSTLATKIWGSYEDGFYSEVGIASLLLVAWSASLTWVLVIRKADAVVGR